MVIPNSNKSNDFLNISKAKWHHLLFLLGFNVRFRDGNRFVCKHNDSTVAFVDLFSSIELFVTFKRFRLQLCWSNRLKNCKFFFRRRYKRKKYWAWIDRDRRQIWNASNHDILISEFSFFSSQLKKMRYF